MNSTLKWLYLPNLFRVPNSTNLIGDFLLLLCTSQQWQVFSPKHTKQWLASILITWNLWGEPNPMPSFIPCRSYLNVKVAIFCLLFWLLGRDQDYPLHVEEARSSGTASAPGPRCCSTASSSATTTCTSRLSSTPTTLQTSRSFARYSAADLKSIDLHHKARSPWRSCAKQEKHRQDPAGGCPSRNQEPGPSSPEGLFLLQRQWWWL